MWHGDIRLGDTIDIKFTTVDTTGLPTTLSGTPVISAYPANSLTELTAGITLSVDFDARTGLNNVRVAATGVNGYLTATNYALVITTGTVGGTSVVGYTIGSFSIEARSAVMPTTAARTLDIAAGGEAGIDLDNTVGTLSAAEIPNLDAAITTRLAPTVAGRTLDVAVGGEAGLDLDNTVGTLSAAEIPNLDVAVSTRLAPTVASRTLDVAVGGEAGIDLDNTVGTLAKTTDITGFNDLSAAQVNAEVDAALDTAIPGVNTANSVNDVLLDQIRPDVSAILVDTGTTLDGRIPAALVAGRIDASVGAMAADVVTAAAIAAGAIGVSEAPNLDAAITTRATPAQVKTQVVDALNVDTYAEPAQGAPPATATLVQRLQYLYKAWRNRTTSVAATISLYNDDAVTVDQKSSHSDNGTTYDRGEFTTGP